MPEVQETPTGTMPIETPTHIPSEPTISNDIIERVRTEEKQKLYASLERKENKIKEAEKQLSEAKDREKEFEEYKNKVELEKLEGSQRLAKENEQLHKKLQDEGKLRAQESAILTEKIRIYELAQFKTDRVRESGLDPDFSDMVFGNTQEEIVASIEKAKAKEESLIKKFSGGAAKEPVSPPTTNPGSPYPSMNVEPPDIRQVKSRDDLEQMKIKLGLKPNI